MNQTTDQTWNSFCKKGRQRWELFCLVAITVVVLCFMKHFLHWNEMRPGLQMKDIILDNIPSFNLSILTLCLTNITLFIGLIILLKKPKTTRLLLVSLFLLSSIRMFCMYLLPLEPPIGIIPLRDFLLENTFYSNQVMVKDLFFSGHTANLFLMALLLEHKKLKVIVFVICSIVGMMLLLQHVHYTLDVIVAPFAAYLAYVLAKKILAYISITFYIEIQEAS